MKIAMLILAILCFVASGAMYMIGANSSHISELKDFFWVPLPLAIMFFIAAMAGKKKSS